MFRQAVTRSSPGTGGGGGKDAELKGFGGWRFTDVLRAGVDSRLQIEVADTETQVPGGVQTGRDYDPTVGPAVSWIVARTLGGIARNLQLQALAGMAQPKKTDVTTAVGILSAVPIEETVGAIEYPLRTRTATGRRNFASGR